MKFSKTFKAIITLIAILIASCVLTIPLHKILHPLFKVKFEAILNRLVEVFIVAAIVFSMRNKKIRWSDYGFNFHVRWKRLFAWGFALGAAMVLLTLSVETAFGPRYIRQPIFLQDIIERFFKGLMSGVAVGIVEEFLFRGFLFTTLERKLKSAWALILTSVIYSAVHFLDNGQIFVSNTPVLGDTIWLLLGYFEPFVARPMSILPEFIGLFIFGVALNLAFLRTRSLFLSIGIHAGAVFWIKFQHSFFRAGPDVFHTWYGKNPTYDGLFEWLVLAFLAVVVYWFAPKMNK